MNNKTSTNRNRISRRRVLGNAAAVTAFSALNFLVPRASRGQDKMTGELFINCWSGFFQDGVRQSLVEPFEKEFGVKVRVGVTATPAELMTRIRVGATSGGGDVIDVFWIPYPQAFSAIQQGWVEPFRIDNIPNYKSVLSPVNKLERPVPWDPGPDIHSAPAGLVSRGIAYNPKFINRKLESLDEIWSQELGHRIGIINDTSWIVGNCAFHTGQDPNDIKDIEKVWATLRDQRKIVGRYFANLVEGQEMFKNETAWIETLNGGRVLALRKDGLNLEYYKPKEGWMLNADVLQIGKGTQNRLTAEKFIDFFYRPDNATRASELLNFPIASKNVQPTDAVRALPDFDSTYQLAGARLYNPSYWDANASAWAEKVKEIIAS